MKVRFLPPAEQELNEAAVYYESRVPGLGVHFLDLIDAAVNEIRDHPEGWEEVDEGIRRRVVRRFPYSILYTSQTEEIVVIAVMHHKQKPRYWVTRL
ncbi:type II toxin-antitoxin system RelE/ParE family toxin [Thermodesulfobacteriota bacterium B35]